MKTNRNILSASILAIALIFTSLSLSAGASGDEAESEISVMHAPEVNVTADGIEVDISDDDEHTVIVYALTGQIVRTETAGNGKTSIDLPRGYYIVKVDKTAKWIIII